MKTQSHAHNTITHTYIHTNMQYVTHFLNDEFQSMNILILTDHEYLIILPQSKRNVYHKPSLNKYCHHHHHHLQCPLQGEGQQTNSFSFRINTVISPAAVGHMLTCTCMCYLSHMYMLVLSKPHLHGMCINLCTCMCIQWTCMLQYSHYVHQATWNL